MKNLTPISVRLIVIISLACTLGACHQNRPTEKESTRADSLIDQAVRNRELDHVLILADSLLNKKEITETCADLWRGWAYHRKHEYSNAEDYYNRVLHSRINTPEDEESYRQAAGYLTDLLYIKHDYEGALRVAVPIVQKIEQQENDSPDAIIMLLSSIGRCQMKLNRLEDAAKTFQKTYQYNLKAMERDTTGTKLRNAVVHTGNIAIRYLNAKIFSEAQPWIERTQSLLEQYAQRPDAIGKFVEEYHARLNIYQAYVLEELGKHEKAEEIYRAYTTSAYSHTDDGRSDACEYLIAAHRYQEAADNLKELDRMMDAWGYELTLDNIQSYLLPKYRANMGAGRRDSALAVAIKICDALDSAIVWQKNSDGAELATIYETQQKEMMIAQQELNISQVRMIAIAITLGLVILFLVSYTIYRRKSVQRLAEKNTQLEIANAKAEESSKMKTDFIQQISHEIRTPLNILSGFTQVLTTSDMQLDEVTRQDINRQITENTNRITEVVNKMLELSDVNSTVFLDRNDEVSVTQIATQAVADIGINQSQHILFNLQLPADIKNLMLKTNQRAATRALSLLLDNARKFTQPAPDRHAAETVTEVQTVNLAVSVVDRKVLFTVEDSGIGVPQEEADHIFEEFVQLDEYYEGTGIGLTVARSLARRLGGDIVLDTSYHLSDGQQKTLGPGARFIMSLPL